MKSYFLRKVKCLFSKRWCAKKLWVAGSKHHLNVYNWATQP